MTRCPEFYEKWEKEPNWCDKCPSAVSQINSYLEWVGELETAGVDRDFTFVNLPEAVARNLFSIKDEHSKKETVKNLTSYLSQPHAKKLSRQKLRNLIVPDSVELRQPKPPAYDIQIQRNEKRIAEYQKRIHELEQENEKLRQALLDEPHKPKLTDQEPIADTPVSVTIQDSGTG
jgi:hypothetical protein